MTKPQDDLGNAKERREDGFALALDFLSRRMLTEKELLRRLIKKGVWEEDAKEAATRCKGYGYLNDSETGRCIIRAGIRGGHGKQRIRFDLLRRGIAEPLVTTLLDEVEDEALDASLEQVARKKWERLHEADLRKRKARLYRFLVSRGFAVNKIFSVLDRFEKED